ncbi:MAG: hypothetical protein CL920_08220 [Deltaproteobacteria bacterium]|nr:hypothetical protein [Deltaproteobacteria bacterium]MBU48665.1 hypothetical protein [Deltaproteobacteria bacterium]|tara:strand:- start:18191 stop:18679 length:489 start_codon:yes stop_codon:yes gene_type:complete
MPEVVFCHGLESAPHGRKYQALKEAGVDVVAPDFQGMDLNQRVEKLVTFLDELDVLPVLVGSSYGGITAVLAAQLLDARGKTVPAMVLCAPALGRKEPPVTDVVFRYVAPTVVIHGTQDDVVPIEGSRQYKETVGCTLHEVEDGHRLAASVDLIVQETKAFL